MSLVNNESAWEKSENGQTNGFDPKSGPIWPVLRKTPLIVVQREGRGKRDGILHTD